MEQIPLSRRLWLCVAAWVIAVVAMALVEGGPYDWESVFLPPMFTPVGLLVLFFADSSSHTSGYTAASFGWLYYFTLTIWSLCTKRRSVFIWAFSILSISLLLNVGGCAAIQHGSWRTEREVSPPMKVPLASFK
jgi:hypothetical protein